MKTHLVILAAAVSVLTAISLHAGTYFQDFSGSAIGDTNFSDGSQLFTTTPSVAQVVFAPYNELQLTANGIANVYSAYELPDLDSGAPVYAFSAKWNMPVYGNFPSSADGFSFNFGQLNSLNLATNASLESGYGVGLSFDVQTYLGNNPGFYLRVGTNIVASLPYNPQTEWGVNNGTRHFFEVDWNYYTGMTVRMDSTNTIFSNVAITNFVPRSGDRFVFAARCGGSSEFIRLDNILVWTGGNLVPLPASTPYFTAGGELFTTPANVFDGNPNDFWATGSPLPTGIGATFLPTNTVVAYTLTSANTGVRAADPASWTLQGSGDGGSTWPYLLGNGGGYFQNDGETHACLATGSANVADYRLLINTNNNNSFTELGKLRLYALSRVGAPLSKNSWLPVNLPSGSWASIACSSNGTVVVAAENNSGNIYVSRDAGTTWTLTPASGNFVCSSASGLLLSTLNRYNGTVFYSTNSGSNWVSSSFPNRPWNDISPTAGGSFFAVSSGSPPSATPLLVQSAVNFSTGDLTYGILQQDAGQYGGSGFQTVCCVPSNASLLAAATTYGQVYYSTDRGSTMHQSSIPGTATWLAMASSINGNLMLLGGFGSIIRSTDAGATWSSASGPNVGYFTSFASSADGTNWLAATDSGLFISTNSAGTWTLANAPVQVWASAASTWDGSRLFAGENSGSLYTTSPTNTAFVTPSAPALQANFTANSGTASQFFWPLTSGGNFVLQQSSDLKNWSNVIWPVIISGNNYQVTVPNSAGNSFFRLKTP